MRRLWIMGMLVWLVLSPAQAAAIDAANLIKGLTADAIGILDSTEPDSRERKTKLESLFRSSLDIPFLGKFVIGRYWRQMSEPEKAEYMKAFEHYVLSVYAGRLNEYSGESLRVLDTRPVDAVDTIVTSQLTRKDRAPVAIDWRVRQNEDDAKVIDVSVEGVSMAMSQRQEFNSILQREGVAGLIRRLENAEPHDPGPPR